MLNVDCPRDIYIYIIVGYKYYLYCFQCVLPYMRDRFGFPMLRGFSYNDSIRYCGIEKIY